jgi:L-aspartate oxidase
VNTFHTIIVGTGLSGCVAALELAETKTVALITKRSLMQGSSYWAQGGIAAVLNPDVDSVSDHVEDTIIAGAGLCDPSVCHTFLSEGPSAVQWLIDHGVVFTKENGSLHLTREGGHRHRRVAHIDDATGAAIQTVLLALIRANKNITIFEHHMLVDLITAHKLGHSTQRCFGLYALDVIQDEVKTFTSEHVILATGGAGKVYRYTTNPDTATGDGIAVAWRAGSSVANMEFIQFHPTCLFHPEAKTFLISEAVRGEGGILRLPDGTAFMAKHDTRAELAPRDIVARAIDFEMKRLGIDCVYLDITHKSAHFIREHFPNIYERCLTLGIDMTLSPIPVVPAAHYTCGGIVVNAHGSTDIPSLWAIGENACTGFHGANRLASNSLLECVVSARSTVRAILKTPELPLMSVPLWDSSLVRDVDEEVIITHNWEELRHFMWDYVGIVRTDKRLERAAHRIRLLEQEIIEFYSNFHVSRDLLELRNLVQVASLIVQSAQKRHESRGLHFSSDYPGLLPKAKATLLLHDNNQTE